MGEEEEERGGRRGREGGGGGGWRELAKEFRQINNKCPEICESLGF